MNKQIRFSAESLSPLFKTSVGFDNLVNEFFNEPQFANATGYPPYNISKDTDNVYEITLAVAGFKKSDIELELDHPTRICTKITLIVKFTHHSYDNRILNLILIQVGRVETWIAARSVASPVGGVVSEAVALL